jgi:hypothetical protein
MTNSASNSQWLDDLHTPCDPKIFRRALDVWQAGGQFKLRKSKPKQKGLYLADIPVNRSAMATIGFLKARGVKNTQAYLWRTMHFGQLLEHLQPGGLLAKYVKLGSDKDSMMVSEALLDAVAIAPVKLPNDPAADACVFDVEEIARIAEEIWRADSGGDEEDGR